MTKLRVLIADDEEFLCELYQMIIESEFACEITKVYDGESAITLINNNAEFDFIISDFNMPKASGGALFLANKAHNNFPFFLFSGGDINDYVDFKGFKEVNHLNHFFNKPFDEALLVKAIEKIIKNMSVQESSSSENLIMVRLSYYMQYTKNAADIFIKLNDNKYTKIMSDNDENLPDGDLLEHYKNKGIEFIYLEKINYQKFIGDVFIKYNENILNEKKLETIFKISGFDIRVCVEGLNSIGISNTQIENTNKEIHESIVVICANSESKQILMKLCEVQGMIVGHSSLIIYIAAAICRATNLPFSSTVRKITIASIFHDLSIFNDCPDFDENKIDQTTDVHMLKVIAEHPVISASWLPQMSDLIEDTKKIILEHHELPNGNGFPKQLTATQIAQLSCLFILSQQLVLCLLRNNFSTERLQDFLINSEEYDQGNFSKFYKAAKSIFFPRL